MKPITHPLAIAYCEAMASGSRTGRAYNEWSAAGRPLYVAPTPLPAPALGMRVWTTAPDLGGAGRFKTRTYDVGCIWPGATWADYTNESDTITHIVDFRTDEVIWRRQ